jgi:hypothetical protein
MNQMYMKKLTNYNFNLGENENFNQNQNPAPNNFDSDLSQEPIRARLSFIR